MSEAARPDELSGARVVVAGSRQHRPNRPGTGACPFCVGGTEAPEPYDVLAFPNRWPAFPDGRCEVVLYTPDHDASFPDLAGAAARRVVDLWAERTEALGDRPEVDYVLVFENRGEEVGATVAHPHGQIYAYPFVPPRVQQVVRNATAHHGRSGRCLHCDLLAAELRDGARVIATSAHFVAFVPAAARWPLSWPL